MVTDQQVRRLLKLLGQEQTLALAAAKAGMDEKTARKYRRLGKLPSQNKTPRWWGTRVRWAETSILLANSKFNEI